MLNKLEEVEKDIIEKCLSENYELLKKGILPKKYINRSLNRYSGLVMSGNYINWRDKYIKEFGFPIFSEDWVKPLAKWIGDRPCLEIMAGTGYLSYALSLYGVNIKATDDFSWKKHFDTFLNVENCDCLEAIKKYGKNIKFLVCSWPYMDNMAYKCLRLMREVNPKCRMIYIGEDWGGCTADDAFFDIAEECEVDGFNTAVLKYRRWEGLHDKIILYK